MRALLLAAVLLAGAAQAQTSSVDPFDSGQWPVLAAEHFKGQAVVFDRRVAVTAPSFAEDPMNVPVLVDASALPDVERVVVLVDRNPIRKVLEYLPTGAKPVLSFRFKLEQSSPVRAAARTKDGVWHVGGAWVESTGGGCTVPGATRANATWPQTLGQVSGRVFERDASDAGAGSSRLRVKIMHPMDTGLVSGIPAFYIDELRLTDEAGTEYMKILTWEPVSENPVFSFDLGRKPQGALLLVGRDNNGNRIRARIAQ